MAWIASVLLLILAVLFPSILFAITLSRRPSKKKNIPPSPRGLPIIGNIHQLGLRPHRTLRALAERHGPLMLLRLGPTPVLVVSSASAARSILRTHDLAFAGRPPAVVGARLMYGYRDLAFAPYGEYWRQARRVCVLHLLSARRVRAARAIREQEVALLVNKLKQHAASSEPESAAVEVDMSNAIFELTNNITSLVALGRRYHSEESGAAAGKDAPSGGNNIVGLRELIEEFSLLIGTFNVADYIPWLAWLNKINGLDARMDKNAAELDRLLEKILDEHIARAKENCSGLADGEDDDGMDFLDVLLSLREGNQGESDTADGAGRGICLDQESVKALLMDMFVAGTHTVFTTIDWAMAELMQHTEVMEKLQCEVRQIGKNKPMLDEDDMKDMNYLKVVIKEVLRLHIPVPLLVPRQSIEDVELDGYHIPKGTRVFINAWAIARDPNQWERPEDFWPERFTNGCMDVDIFGADFQLIPFGAGRRGCPGIHFALPIVELMLANLLYKFDWEIPNRNKGLRLDMTETGGGVTACRQSHLILVAKPH